MNNSKQTVLSIVGIAILVIAVVGVSFAFFTYSKTGTTNNVITTGSIAFDSDINTVSALTLTNQFPQEDEDGDDNATYNFTVHGTIPTSASTVYYGVYVVKGDTPDGKVSTNSFANDEISIKVTNNGGTVVSPYGTAGALTNAVDTTPGLLVSYGSITANNTSQTHALTLTMWVNNTVTISDTDSNADYRAKAYDATNWPEGSSSDTRKVYSDMWYSLKVNVEARDTTPYGS